MVAGCGHEVELVDWPVRQDTPAACDYCEQLAADRERLEAIAKRRNLRRASTNVPQRYHDQSFGDLLELGWAGDIVLAAQAWAQGGTIPGLYLFGPNGTGKTTLAAVAALDYAARNPRPLMWVRAAQLGRWLLSDYDSVEYKQAQRICGSSTALVLDDLGQEHSNPLVATGIKDALENRLDAAAPILITSNLSVPQLATRDVYGTWLGSRLAGRDFRQYVMAGADHRLDP